MQHFQVPHAGQSAAMNLPEPGFSCNPTEGNRPGTDITWGRNSVANRVSCLELSNCPVDAHADKTGHCWSATAAGQRGLKDAWAAQSMQANQKQRCMGTAGADCLM